jgi:hypothetical protein
MPSPGRATALLVRKTSRSDAYEENHPTAYILVNISIEKARDNAPQTKPLSESPSLFERDSMRHRWSADTALALAAPSQVDPPPSAHVHARLVGVTCSTPLFIQTFQFRHGDTMNLSNTIRYELL